MIVVDDSIAERSRLCRCIFFVGWALMGRKLSTDQSMAELFSELASGIILRRSNIASLLPALLAVITHRWSDQPKVIWLIEIGVCPVWLSSCGVYTPKPTFAKHLTESDAVGLHFTFCCLFCTCLTSSRLQVHMTKWRAIIQHINQLTSMLFGD
jgi:hypothetical protein